MVSVKGTYLQALPLLLLLLLLLVQDCFKKHWPLHKSRHKTAAPKQTGVLPGFTNYNFSGPLRPAPLSETRQVPAHIKKPDYADHPRGASASEEQERHTNVPIPVYTPQQIAGIR